MVAQGRRSRRAGRKRLARGAPRSHRRRSRKRAGRAGARADGHAFAAAAVAAAASLWVARSTTAPVAIGDSSPREHRTAGSGVRTAAQVATASSVVGGGKSSFASERAPSARAVRQVPRRTASAQT